MSKTIIVTGGAGFIGSHLCKRLLDQGHTVVCIDNYYTSSMDNIKDLIDEPRFHVRNHDVIKPLQVEIEQQFDVDLIYNLACPASPPYYQKQPAETIRACVIGTDNMLEFARRNGATLLQASTSEVYGDPLVHPQVETYWGNVNPIGARACYDEGKRCAETLMFCYRSEYGLPIKVARIFNTYGPGMQLNDGRVVSNFIVQALQNKPITIYGDGNQTRSFCYVSDLVTGLIRLMDTTGPDFTGPVNLGNPGEFTVRELAEMVLGKTGSRSSLTFRHLPEDDPRQRRPDITLARNALGWEPIVNINTGLDRTIAYFDTVLSMSISAE